MEQDPTNNPVTLSTPANTTPAPASIWGWLDVAKSQAFEMAAKAQVYAEQAGKVAQEKAMEIAKQAQEIQEKYDLEVTASILMGTTGGMTAQQRSNTMNNNNNNNINIDEIKLTKADLNALDMVYITENILAMAYPLDLSAVGNAASSSSATDPESLPSNNDINIVAAFLRQKHTSHFMIWNISEESYDYTKFSDQVLEYKFPGHPAPPLGLLCKICTSVESWLEADPANIAIIHCLTGKGRTATVIACILTWLGEFDSPMQALQYTAQRKQTLVDYLTIPSQRRYIQYFSNLLDGVKPNSEPLLLRRVILNGIPAFGLLPGGSGQGSGSSSESKQQGCCPYIQLFKNGKLVASAAIDVSMSAALPEHHDAARQPGDGQPPTAAIQTNNKMSLQWISTSDGSASFTIDTLVQGDILLRCRHMSHTGARVSMFRAAFHTGYISPGGVLRLTKAQLDGAASDARFTEEFFMDLIFSPMTVADSGTGSSAVSGLAGEVDAAIGAANTGALSMDKYETNLHKDARFWEAISTRKSKAKKRKMRKFRESQQDQFSIDAGEGSLFRGAGGSGTGNAIEIDFTRGNGGSKGGGGKGSEDKGEVKTSYVDEDLIKQLALLDEEMLMENTATGPSSSSSSSSTATAAATTTASPIAATSAVTPAAASSGSSSTAITTPAGKDSSSSSGSANRSNELDALEDLEKELGLSDLHLFSAASTTGTLATATGGTGGGNSNSAAKSTTAKAAVDDDNLDELEQYLQSLSSK